MNLYHQSKYINLFAVKKLMERFTSLAFICIKRKKSWIVRSVVLVCARVHRLQQHIQNAHKEILIYFIYDETNNTFI